MSIEGYDHFNPDHPVSFKNFFQSDLEIEKENNYSSEVKSLFDCNTKQNLYDYSDSIIDIRVQSSQENLSTQISLNSCKGEMIIDQELSNFNQKEDLDNSYQSCKPDEIKKDNLINSIDDQPKFLSRENINKKFLSRLCKFINKFIQEQGIYRSNRFKNIPFKYRNASYDKVKEFFSLNLLQLYHRENINLDVSFTDKGKELLLINFGTWALEYINSYYFLNDLLEITKKLSSKYCENDISNFIKLYAYYNPQLVGT
jgi:hypothetical protein